MSKLDNDILKVCISQKELDEMITKVANQINKDFDGKNPLFIGVLKGSVPFMTDLMKKITIPCTMDYIKVSSYSGTKSTGNIIIKGDFPDIIGRNVVIIEDILDTGRTLSKVLELMRTEGAQSVTLCVLLDKPDGRVVPIEADYVGGLVPNEFVVGYGLDYDEKYRNLPYIGVLKEEVYKNN